MATFLNQYETFKATLYGDNDGERGLYDYIDFICRCLRDDPISLLVNEMTPLVDYYKLYEKKAYKSYADFFDVFHVPVAVPQASVQSLHDHLFKADDQEGQLLFNNAKEEFYEDYIKNVAEEQLKFSSLRQALINQLLNLPCKDTGRSLLSFKLREKAIIDERLKDTRGASLNPFVFQNESGSKKSVMFSALLFLPKGKLEQDDCLLFLVAHSANEGKNTAPFAFQPYYGQYYERSQGDNEPKVGCLQYKATNVFKKAVWKRNAQKSFTCIETLPEYVQSFLFPQVLDGYENPKYKQAGLLCQIKNALASFCRFATNECIDVFDWHCDFFERNLGVLKLRKSQEAEKKEVLSKKDKEEQKVKSVEHLSRLSSILGKRYKQQEVDDDVQLSQDQKKDNPPRADLKKAQSDTEEEQEDQECEEDLNLEAVMESIPKMSASARSTRSRGSAQGGSAGAGKDTPTTKKKAKAAEKEEKKIVKLGK